MPSVLSGESSAVEKSFDSLGARAISPTLAAKKTRKAMTADDP